MIFPFNTLLQFLTLYFLLDNIDFVFFLIPKCLQLIGIIGWIWEGYMLYRDRLWKKRANNIFRATLTWSVGILLEYFFNNIYLF